jgi:hypothetical protein
MDFFFSQVNSFILLLLAGNRVISLRLICIQSYVESSRKHSDKMMYVGLIDNGRKKSFVLKEHCLDRSPYVASFWIRFLRPMACSNQTPALAIDGLSVKNETPSFQT